MSFCTDNLDDADGQFSGFSTAYTSRTLGLTHIFKYNVEVRPEIRY